MLKKLLKHEWIATARRYVLFYLVLAAVTLFTALVRMIDIDSIIISGIQGLLTGAYVITVFGVLFCSIGLAVVRFYKNMVTDEGYLTFTLPAKVEQLVGAKLIVALVWQAITIAAILLSLGCVFVFGKMGPEQISELIRMFEAESGIRFPVFAAVMAVCLVYQLLLYYLAVAVGQLFPGNKIVGSVIGYLVLSFVIEIAMVVCILCAGCVIGFAELDSFMQIQGNMTAFMFALASLMVIIAVAEYFLTCNLLKIKLNLA
ncbi:MAG: hypothetical protein IJW37_01155 [Lachnospiraceae bacterium]|nr:hypothetical protein [Lachnospiraceae bacterium]